jgi:ABC-2 type transport system ATP-binding protein
MILDEPTLGLDIPFRRLYLDQLLSDYFTDERTIVIATHQLEEFERIFDQVVFLHQGRLVLHEPVDALKKRFSVIVLNAEQTGLIDPQNRYRLGGFMHEERYLVKTDILSSNEQLAALPTKEPDLTDVFLGVIEGGLR